MKYYIAFIIIAIAIFSNSCQSLINIKGDIDKVKNLESIALLNVYICPPSLPVFPIVDVALYSAGYNSIYSDINMFHFTHADSIVNYFGSQLDKYSPSRVIYGDSLNKILTAKALDSNNIITYPLFLNNADFPKIPIYKNSFNFFNFSKESSPIDYFNYNNLEIDRINLTKICNLLKVECLMVVLCSVPTTEVYLLGIQGRRNIREYIIYFDKSGSVFCTVSIKPIGTNAMASDYAHYLKQFSNYKIYSDAFFRNIYLGEKLKTTPKRKSKSRK